MLSINDIFLKSKLFKNAAIMPLGEKTTKYQMIEMGAHTTKHSIREYVVGLGFKNKNEAKAYYFIHLICTLIDLHGREAFSGSGD